MNSGSEDPKPTTLTIKPTSGIAHKLESFIYNSRNEIPVIFWPDMASKEVERLTGGKNIIKEIITGKWRWIRHMLGIEDENISKKTRVEQPKETW